jgi:hypothetical protein
VLFDPDARLQVKVGDKVRGGASVLAHLQPKAEMASAVNRVTEGAR